MRNKKYDEDDFLMTCALRFDGYKYNEEMGRQSREPRLEMSEIAQRLMKTKEFFDDINENLWAFFIMQRGFKWGGEFLTRYSDEHLVYMMLFLHVYREEIHRDYQYSDFGCFTKWEREYKPVREKLAAQIRQTLRRRGRGAKFYSRNSEK